MSVMDNSCVVTLWFGLTITITGWKVLGFTGALCFAARWVVQARHRQRTGNATIPTTFWIISVLGAGLTTIYFIFGKNDSVGILGNALPLGVALYNLVLDLRHRRAQPPNG